MRRRIRQSYWRHSIPCSTSGDYTAAERFWSPNYIQHSAHIPAGRDGLLGLISVHTDGGSIILNASIDASKEIGNLSVYSATKAAVRSFARTWTVDLKDRRIRVNALSPGYIDTAPWRSDSVAEIRASIMSLRHCSVRQIRNIR